MSTAFARIRPLAAGTERRKLALSLAANFLTRVPGLLLMLVVLPQFYRGLGPAAYSALFAALAFGGLGVFLLGGAAVPGMREIGAAAAEGRRQDEADAFVSLLASNALLTAVLMAGVVAAGWIRGDGVALILVALMPLTQAGLTTTIDNCRLAHNEHYWAATLSFGFQLVCYALVFTLPAYSSNVLLAATIFHAPIALASAVNAVLLMRARPYLWRGRANQIRAMLRAAVSFGAADGVLTASLGLTLIGIQAWAPAETAAWLATQFRLFQMCLNPVMTVMVPVASFLRLRWSHVAVGRQHRMSQLAFGAGVLACIALGGGLGIAGPLYAGHLLRLPMPDSGLWLAPIFLFLGVTGFYRVYASVANLVLDGERLARGIIAAILFAALAASLALILVPPLHGFALFCAVASGTMLGQLALSRQRSAAISAQADHVEILGTPVSLTDHRRAAERVLSQVAARHGGYVCVRDVHAVMLARGDAGLREIARGAILVLPDGMPIVHAARLRGHRTIARVAGPDFVDTLADRGRSAGIRHYFHGAGPGVAERMAANLVRRYPGICIAGCSSPGFGEPSNAEREAELQQIRAAAPDIVWVGLGMPKQERWMYRNTQSLPGITLIGVGAAFDFHAGTVKRAPLWMRRMTLEWLHRLLSEPRRLWRRYLVIAPAFVWHVLWERGA
jgi:N-acetylglucosaminyldiphosphoundecaprenol N-acetyl-beta-D-mannosaminyltransferase